MQTIGHHSVQTIAHLWCADYLDTTVSRLVWTPRCADYWTPAVCRLLDTAVCRLSGHHSAVSRLLDTAVCRLLDTAVSRLLDTTVSDYCTLCVQTIGHHGVQLVWTPRCVQLSDTRLLDTTVCRLLQCADYWTPQCPISGHHGVQLVCTPRCPIVCTQCVRLLDTIVCTLDTTVSRYLHTTVSE